VTTSSSSTVSTTAPKRCELLLMPPALRMPPTESVMVSPMAGGVSPCGTVPRFTSSQDAPA